MFSVSMHKGTGSMRRLSTIVIAGTLPLAALLLGVSPSLAQPIANLDNAALVPALAQPQTDIDRAVSTSLHRSLVDKLDPSTVRLLGENSQGKFIVALNSTGEEVCIISQMSDELQITGTSCARKEKFAQDGVSVGLQGTRLATSGSTVTYLLPLGVDAAPLKALTPTAEATLKGRATTHLIVQTGSDRLPDKAELKRSSSPVTFKFQKLHVAGR